MNREIDDKLNKALYHFFKVKNEKATKIQRQIKAFVFRKRVLRKLKLLVKRKRIWQKFEKTQRHKLLRESIDKIRHWAVMIK